MKYKLFLFLIVGLLLVNLAISQITCNKNVISVIYDEGQSTSDSIQCSNSGNNSVAISKSGDYFTLSDNTIGQAPSSKTLTINFDSNAPTGTYFGSIDFNDGSQSIPITIIVNEIEDTECDIIIFPKSIKNIKIRQGEKIQKSVKITVPECYGNKIDINGIELEGDLVNFMQYSEPAFLEPGDALTVPFEIDAEGASTGNYPPVTIKYSFLDKGLEVRVPDTEISFIVTSGITPMSNFSLSDPPTCTLDDIDLNLNSTHSLTCSLPNPNINIHPLIDSRYIEGVSVEETSSQYIYKFKPIIIGETKIGAEFLYKFAPLFQSYQQEVRISPSGNSPVSGITLKPIFYQDDRKTNINEIKSGKTRIIIVDNKTDSTVVYQGILLNGVNVSNEFDLESGKEYDLRISALGFLDLVLNFSVNESFVSFSIIPDKEIYYIGDYINLTSPQNASFLINDIVPTLPYKFTSVGFYNIKSIKEGYISANKTIEVREYVTYTSTTPLIEDWKKGSDVKIQLSKNASWEIYKDNVKVKSGESRLVDFEIEDYGVWELRSGERGVISKTIEKTSEWYKPWTWNWVLNLGYWWLGVVGLGGLGIWYFFIRDTEEEIPQPYRQGVE